MLNAAARDALIEAVRFNSHLADARHATELPMCSYLLQMREFFRWEHAVPLGATLPRDAVGAWLAEREALWATLEDADYQPLPGPGGTSADAFDVGSVNAWLADVGLFYGAGLAGRDRPVFVLAERLDAFHRGVLDVQPTGAERVRGLAAPPAVLGWSGDERTVLLRRDALARWCWQRYEAWTLRRTPGSAMEAVVRAWRLDEDLEAGLARWLDAQSEVLILHEQGEWQAGRWLDPGWAALRTLSGDARTERLVAAVRDQIADLTVTLPALLGGAPPASLHFFFEAYEGARQALYPALAQAYTRWREGDGGVALRVACARGATHFETLARDLLQLQAAAGTEASAAVAARLAQALAGPPV